MELNLAARSLQYRVSPRDARTPIRETLAVFLADLATRMDADGCTFIGHIKGRVEAAGEELLFFSLTRLGGQPQFKGGIWLGADDLDMSVSAIVAGLDKEEIGRAMQDTLETYFRIFSEEAKT